MFGGDWNGELYMNQPESSGIVRVLAQFKRYINRLNSSWWWCDSRVVLYLQEFGNVNNILDSSGLVVKLWVYNSVYLGIS